MWMREMSKYLAGGCAVYAVVAACGSVPSGSSDGGDLLDAMARPIPQADAQAAECGQCNLPTPVKVLTADTDPAQDAGGRVDLEPITSDSVQYEARKVTDGGFVLTGAQLANASPRLYLVGSAESCLEDPLASTDQGAVGNINAIAEHWTLLWWPNPEDATPLTGTQIRIPSDQKLCVFSDLRDGGTLFWSGYRPYEG